MSRQDQIEHFVSSEPFDPASIEALTPAQEKYYMASQWMLMWWKLKRHRLCAYLRHYSGIELCIGHVQRNHRTIQPAHT